MDDGSTGPIGGQTAKESEKSGGFHFLKKLFGGKSHRGGNAVTESEIISIVDEANEKGVLEKNEAEMIQNIISFNDMTARDVMTHRTVLDAIEGETSLAETAGIMLNSSHSRFPVYSGTIDNIAGLITLKDVMRYLEHHPAERERAIADIPALIREAAVFTETSSVEQIFQFMRTEKIHLVMIVDEYGQVAGVVTMEDILEEIVGNIQDEYDAETPYIQKEFDDSVVMDGLTPLADAGAVLGDDFEDLSFETLNGYLTSLLGHIPTGSDTVVRDEHHLYRILEVERHVIKKVRVERLARKKGE